MNISYLIYVAERPLSRTERREADIRAGELAAAVARLTHSLRPSARGKRGAARGAQRPAVTGASRAIPRPREPVDR
jgi:hypothetical protein